MDNLNDIEENLILEEDVEEDLSSFDIEGLLKYLRGSLEAIECFITGGLTIKAPVNMARLILTKAVEQTEQKLNKKTNAEAREQNKMNNATMTDLEKMGNEKLQEVRHAIAQKAFDLCGFSTSCIHLGWQYIGGKYSTRVIFHTDSEYQDSEKAVFRVFFEVDFKNIKETYLEYDS